MKKIFHIVITVSAILSVNTAFSATHELKNCSQLQAAKTVLMVHASWCSHCKHYLPIYKAVSRMPEMSGYTFYTKDDEGSIPICGVAINAVPVTFVHNMKHKMVGSVSADQLIRFIKE